MKKFYKFILLFCGFSFFFWNCQRDTILDTQQTGTPKSQFKTKTIKLADIPNVESFLLSKSKNNIFNQKSTIDGAIFDQDHILEVIDTLNNTNYTFKFSFPDTPIGVYYNLVVGKAPNGDLLEPFILKFVSDSTHLEEFIANDYKFSYFRGQMGIHKYTDYFQTGLGLKTEATGCTPTYDAFGDPIACDVVGFSSSGSSGGGATSIGVSSNGVSTTGGSGGSSGGSASCSWSVTYLPCLCEGRADGHSAEICGCGTGSPTVLTIYCPPAYKMNTANKTTSTVNPCPDCPSGSEGGVGVSLSDTALNNIINTLQLGANDKVRLTWLKLEATPAEIDAINKFLFDNHNTAEAVAFIKEAITALMNKQFNNFDEILYNKTALDSNVTGDLENNVKGNEDVTIYINFDPIQQTWPIIPAVISDSDFIGWGFPNIERNCMSYAKAQIGKKGFQISNYYNNTGQTIQVYTEQNGVNQIALQKGLSYLIYALENGIPVIVGVDVHSGSPNTNTDNTTDHFVVIVGMGIDNKGKYFIFYDNASGKTPYQNFGANPNNKLYYKSITGLITGESSTQYFNSVDVEHNYIMTQIRKSKIL